MNESLSLTRRNAIKVLEEKARKGNLEAGKELVRQNRRGSFEIHLSPLEEKDVKAMLSRRAKARGSKVVKGQGATVLG